MDTVCSKIFSNFSNILEENKIQSENVVKKLVTLSNCIDENA